MRVCVHATQRDAPCAVCGVGVTLPPPGSAAFAGAGMGTGAEGAAAAAAGGAFLSHFYAFPCGMAFHTPCLIAAGLPWMAPGQRRRCLDLMAVVQPPLTRWGGGAREGGGGSKGGGGHVNRGCGL